MKEYMEIGVTPFDEGCAQVGDSNYKKIAEAEMDAYINQLNRVFVDIESKGIVFRKKWFHHDFGTYGEVCIVWDTDNEIADQYAYFIDSNLPANWDDEAKEELKMEKVSD